MTGTECPRAGKTTRQKTALSAGTVPAAGAGNGPSISDQFADAVNLCLISVNRLGHIIYANPAALQLFGYTAEEMMGQPIAIIIPERMRGPHNTSFSKVAAGARLKLCGRTVEVYALRKDQSEFPIEITLSIWEGEDGICAGAVIKDITERRERETRLLRPANQDTLTGLNNRRQFGELLTATLSAGQGVAVLLADLDGFKDVNDTHGHGVGDSLLQAVAIRLAYHLPEKAEIARFGGDEFAVLFAGIDTAEDAEARAKEIIDAFAAPFEVGGHQLDLAISAGISLSPMHGTDAEELIASADYALYRAKTRGGCQWVLFDPAMQLEIARRHQIRDELLAAIRAHELALHYQPQVDMTSGAMFGVEALIRWHHPERGLLLPGAFLPALEQTALALEIGWWTLDEACRQGAEFQAASETPIKISVNLFPAQARSNLLCRKVTEALDRYGLAPELLELEMTETIALHDDERLLASLRELRALGVGIAFDDFGTGYASLSSLQRYPLKTLKIDRSFVRDLLDNSQDRAITRALITMSRDLGLCTIAEGVETAEQEAMLLSIGCTGAQGYRYGKPMPADALLERIAGTSTKAGRIAI